MKKFLRRIGIIASVILLLISGLLFVLYLYIETKFSNLSMEQIIYTIFYIKGASLNTIKEAIKVGIINYIIFLLINLIIYAIIKTIINRVYTNVTKKEIKSNLKFFLSYNIIIIIIITIYIIQGLGIISYIKDSYDNSTIFEDYYVNPKEVSITFPNKKKNLIYIFVESLETSEASIENGGTEKISFIPNLETIAQNNINISNSNKIGGAIQVAATGWTIAGMIAQTAGIPLKTKISYNDYHGYSNYLEGAYTLGEILNSNGYKNYLMLGSPASFAGRDEYFKGHGNYEIYDYEWAKELELIPEDYYEWWGYEDNKLFSYAKDKILEISQSNTPFNFTILTADTHFIDGYIDKSCENNSPFEEQYANSFYCSDQMINDFITWIQEQDFYKDTVIIISGDHLTMQNDFFTNMDTDYHRTVYNTFINTNMKDTYSKNRLFTTMDMFPTTLAALNIKIKGNKLGLGTNLFSENKTLLETLGYEQMNEQLKKNSKYYNKNILKNSYQEMYKDIPKEKTFGEIEK